MATRFQLSGGVGDYVRSKPFDERSRQYMKLGLHKVLGDFVGSPRQNLALFNASTKSLPHFATGGVVDKPTVAVVGENGPEAIVPLGKGDGGTPGGSAPSGGNQGPPTGSLDSGITDKSGLGSAAPETSGASSKYFQFQGSPDIFDQTGTRIDQDTATKLGLFDPRGGTIGDVAKVPTPRPGVTSAGDFAKLAGTNINQQAADVEGRTFGAISADDIIKHVNSIPEVQTAQAFHDTNIQNNNQVLAANIKRIADKEGIDEATLANKIAIAKYNLELSLERRGLAGSGFQVIGEKRLTAQKELGTEKLQVGLSDNQQRLEALTLAKNGRIDITLAKNIVSSVNKELQSRARLLKTSQTAFDSYMKSKGMVKNPQTGGYEKTEAEKRAEESSSRAQYSFQKKVKADQATGNTNLSDGTPVTKILNRSQIAGLNASKIPAGLYTAITEDALGGMSKDQIKAEIQKSGGDPSTVDTYDKIVNIGGLQAKQPYKVPKGGKSSGSSGGPFH